jgi:hypothetical protein
MPAKPRITVKAKRAAIAEAYGCLPVETDMHDFYYSRRHLAKLDQANADGWRDLRYQDEEADLRDVIERTLRTILERDGVKYFKEVAANLIEHIASDVRCRAILKKYQGTADRGVMRGAVG